MIRCALSLWIPPLSNVLSLTFALTLHSTYPALIEIYPSVTVTLLAGTVLATRTETILRRCWKTCSGDEAPCSPGWISIDAVPRRSELWLIITLRVAVKLSMCGHEDFHHVGIDGLPCVGFSGNCWTCFRDWQSKLAPGVLA